MAGGIRTELVDTLRGRLGSELDDLDPGDGRMTAHAALRTLGWVLESFGHKEIPHAVEDCGTVEAIVAEFRRRELAWYDDDNDDSDWPRREFNRGQATAHLVFVQRHSLVWTNHPGWVTDDREAEARAHNFLACFPKEARFFSNCWKPRSSWFPITRFTFDTGIIAISDKLAGIWWHAEED